MVLDQLCLPSKLYFISSIIFLLITIFQKYKKMNYKRGIIYLIDLVWIFLFTYILNYICNKYSVQNSWITLIVVSLILPFILSFAMVSLLIYTIPIKK
jgi:hypothetical protein